MTVEEFIASIPVLLTPEALTRAVEANGMRKTGTAQLTEAVRGSWTAARAGAKAAVLATVDVKTPGPTREAAWAAVFIAMDAAGALAVEAVLEEVDFVGLRAPWVYMTTGGAE